MAIEVMKRRVNVSAISDECLAGRLGLLPLRADPKEFGYRDGDATADYGDDESEAKTSLYFQLKVRCDDSTDEATNAGSSDRPVKAVYSSDLKWIPIGSQSERFIERDVGPIKNG